MTYVVKEIFYTLQGEGAQTGRAAVFCRFAGCNLWSGRAKDRPQSVCRFCDTDFVGSDGPGGGKFQGEAELADRIEAIWQATSTSGKKFTVCTGGEPLLQLDRPIIAELHRRGFEVAVETNGTIASPAGIDWLCVSPKAGTELRINSGDELKLVYPQEGAPPKDYEGLAFSHFFLQPMDGPNREINTQIAIRYCLENPKWRLSLQTHKFVGIS